MTLVSVHCCSRLKICCEERQWHTCLRGDPGDPARGDAGDPACSTAGAAWLEHQTHRAPPYLTDCLLPDRPSGVEATVGLYAPKTKSSSFQPSSFSVQTSSRESAPRGAAGYKDTSPPPPLQFPLGSLPLGKHSWKHLPRKPVSNVPPHCGWKERFCCESPHVCRQLSYGYCANAPKPPAEYPTFALAPIPLR